MADAMLRDNELDRRTEPWRPPLFKPVRTSWDRLAAAARRLLDLQAGTLWADLGRLLPDARGSILDVGCGAQPYRTLVHPDATYTGIDYADARRHFGYSMPDTTYYEGGRWPVPDASVDLVLSTETLEHVADPPAFLAEAFRCLKPGGRLLLTVPFSARWHYIPHDYWRFTPSGLDRLLTAAGFSRVAVFARGNALTVACYKAMALPLSGLLSGVGSPWMRLPVRVASLLLLPAVLVLAIIANASLAFRGGADCLGYTVLATRPGADANGSRVPT